MALKLLGETIDIHCGGVDNIFPHHENEIAQSEAFTGTRFVKVWAHSEHLMVDGKKMSKSLGNFYTLRDLIKLGYHGKEIRFYLLLQTHYRTQLNFTMQGLEAPAKSSLERIKSFVIRMKEIKEEGFYGHVEPLCEKTLVQFASALADDLNISPALASLFDLIREIHALADRNSLGTSEATYVLNFLKKIDEVLGVLPLYESRKFQKNLRKPLEKENRQEKRRILPLQMSLEI